MNDAEEEHGSSTADSTQEARGRGPYLEADGASPGKQVQPARVRRQRRDVAAAGLDHRKHRCPHLRMGRGLGEAQNGAVLTRSLALSWREI